MVAADYEDSYCVTLENAPRMTAEDLFRLVFERYPRAVAWLLAARDAVAGRLGFAAGTDFRRMMTERSDGEIRLDGGDRHMRFSVTLSCDAPAVAGGGMRQRVCIATQVRFIDRAGRIYFAAIRPFHGPLVRCRLKSAAAAWSEGRG